MDGGRPPGLADASGKPGLRRRKRTKAGRYTDEITTEDLQKHFGLPAQQAAAAIGCSFTVFKKLCRGFGVKRWPYRRLKAIGLASTPPPVTPGPARAPAATHTALLVQADGGSNGGGSAARSSFGGHDDAGGSGASTASHSSADRHQPAASIASASACCEALACLAEAASTLRGAPAAGVARRSSAGFTHVTAGRLPLIRQEGPQALAGGAGGIDSEERLQHVLTALCTEIDRRRLLMAEANPGQDAALGHLRAVVMRRIQQAPLEGQQPQLQQQQPQQQQQQLVPQQQAWASQQQAQPLPPPQQNAQACAMQAFQQRIHALQQMQMQAAPQQQQRQMQAPKHQHTQGPQQLTHQQEQQQRQQYVQLGQGGSAFSPWQAPRPPGYHSAHAAQQEQLPIRPVPVHMLPALRQLAAGLPRAAAVAALSPTLAAVRLELLRSCSLLPAQWQQLQ